MKNLIAIIFILILATFIIESGRKKNQVKTKPDLVFLSVKQDTVFLLASDSSIVKIIDNDTLKPGEN